jgi:hypothetical protein
VDKAIQNGWHLVGDACEQEHLGLCGHTGYGQLG